MHALYLHCIVLHCMVLQEVYAGILEGCGAIVLRDVSI